MNQLLNRLNLRPQERRLVVAVFVVVFVVLNFWFVVPHFKDMAAIRDQLSNSRTKLEHYRVETDQNRLTPLRAKLKELEGEGSTVAVNERSLDLIGAIQNQQARSGVNITVNTEVNTTSSGKTNEFFEEKARNVSIIAREEQLVDFLVSLGSSNSMIRARSMHLRPDPSHTALMGDIMLVGSYQKERPTVVAPAVKPKSAVTPAEKPKSAVVPAKTPAPSTKPPASNSKSPAVTPKPSAAPTPARTTPKKP